MKLSHCGPVALAAALAARALRSGPTSTRREPRPSPGPVTVGTRRLGPRRLVGLGLPAARGGRPGPTRRLTRSHDSLSSWSPPGAAASGGFSWTWRSFSEFRPGRFAAAARAGPDRAGLTAALTRDSESVTRPGRTRDQESCHPHPASQYTPSPARPQTRLS